MVVDMDIKEVYKLMERFESSPMSSFKLDMEGVSLAMEKNQLGAYNPEFVQKDASKGKSSKEELLGKAKEVESLEADAVLVNAPLVGTFYRAAAPGEKAFVSEGDTVKKGDVLGTIEAMKLMNEITAPSDGVVEVIWAKDGDMVEFGEKLLAIK